VLDRDQVALEDASPPHSCCRRAPCAGTSGSERR
jgi:hypothetical protein